MNTVKNTAFRCNDYYNLGLPTALNSMRSI